jgi:hypothetical protein
VSSETINTGKKYAAEKRNLPHAAQKYYILVSHCAPEISLFYSATKIGSMDTQYVCRFSLRHQVSDFL